MNQKTLKTKIVTVIAEGLEKEQQYYLENGYVVFTEAYHLARGKCCGSGCRHCPYKKKK